MPAYVGYCTPTEFIGFYDSRRVCQLLSATGTPVDVVDLSDPNSDAYAALANNFLLPASGTIDSACQVGRRYSRGDLEGFVTTASTSNDSGDQKRAQILKQLCADLAFGALVSTRGYGSNQVAQMAPRYVEAQRIVEQLTQGTRVFDLTSALNAGVPQVVRIGANSVSSSMFNKLFGVWPDANAHPPSDYRGIYPGGF